MRKFSLASFVLALAALVPGLPAAAQPVDEAARNDPGGDVEFGARVGQRRGGKAAPARQQGKRGGQRPAPGRSRCPHGGGHDLFREKNRAAPDQTA